jgi:hypothetical protein
MTRRCDLIATSHAGAQNGRACLLSSPEAAVHFFYRYNAAQLLEVTVAFSSLAGGEMAGPGDAPCAAGAAWTSIFLQDFPFPRVTL